MGKYLVFEKLFVGAHETLSIKFLVYYNYKLAKKELGLPKDHKVI